MMKTLYFDCSSGISGNMTLGALLEIVGDENYLLNELKKLNIDVVLPNNQSKENLYAFGHGPYNGVVTIESPNKVNFKVNNVKKRTICSSKGCI